ncbi:amidohydrolase family protein [Candidatus Woesearchaeota archaeon]|nr:amidohydrolase family protein [Candidatus Woesearchaeota archaeon]
MKITIFLFLLGVIFLSSCSVNEQIQENKEIIETIDIEPKEIVVEKPAELENKSQIILEPEQPEIILSPEEQVWRNRIESALAPTSCPDVSKPEYPSSYYQGPLTDTHLHIPSIPDWSAEEDEQMQDQDPEGRFGGPQALLGWNVKMSEIACTLKGEGTHKNFAFFPAYEGEISLSQLEIWDRTMQEYPEQFTPFIMSSGNDGDPNGFPTVDAETLKEMLAVELPPDSLRLQQIYPIIKQHNLVVYFHLGDGHKDNFEKVLKQYPDITFIWHGDQLSVEEVKDVLSKHPNAYYGVDEFFGGEREIFELYVGKSKEKYLETANKNFDKIINQAISHWKSLIEQYPDQVMWGTDRGDAVWNYDQDVGQMQVRIARAFIGKLNPAVQEKFAYKNAEKLLQ